VGPAGAVELRGLIRSIEPEHLALKRETLERTPRSAAAVRVVTTDPTDLVTGTEVAPGTLGDRLERPIVAASRNAPTATREDDIRQAIAMLPTEERSRLEDAATFQDQGLTRTGLVRPPAAEALVERPRTGLVIALGATIGLVALIAGLIIGAMTLRSDTPGLDEEPSTAAAPGDPSQPTAQPAPPPAPAKVSSPPRPADSTAVHAASEPAEVASPTTPPAPTTAALSEIGPASGAPTISAPTTAVAVQRRSDVEEAAGARASAEADAGVPREPSKARAPQKVVRPASSPNPFSVPLIGR
jgi:hypothetical protein